MNRKIDPNSINGERLKAYSPKEQVERLQVLFNDTASAATRAAFEEKYKRTWDAINVLLPYAQSRAKENTDRRVLALWLEYLCDDINHFKDAILFRNKMIRCLDKLFSRGGYTLSVYAYPGRLYRVSAGNAFFRQPRIVEMHECCQFMTEEQCEKFAECLAKHKWAEMRKLVTAYQNSEPRAAELEALFAPVKRKASIPNKPKGAFRDLEDVFQACNEAHFEGKMPRPAGLTWSGKVNKRVMGSYNVQNDVLTVNRALDDPKVPDYVVDFIMYHELLHKMLGVKIDSAGRHRAHTAEFRRYERAHPDYERAQKYIQRLSASLS